MKSLCPLFIILFVGCTANQKISLVKQDDTKTANEYGFSQSLNIKQFDSGFALAEQMLDSLVGPIDSTYVRHHPVELDDSGRPIFRYYDTRCNCEPPLQGSDGKPRVSQNSPYADYANDTSLWYWSHPSKEFPDIKVYDLKPQYVDSFLFPDGRWFQAPKWVVEDWKKDAAERYKDSIPVNGYWVRVSKLDYEQWLKKQRSSP